MSVIVRRAVAGFALAVLGMGAAYADDLPAVSGWNGKLEGLRADLNGEGLWATTVNLMIQGVSGAVSATAGRTSTSKGKSGSGGTFGGGGGGA